MKRILTFVLALTMILSLTACGGKGQNGNNADDPANEITLSAQEVLDTMKEKLGESYTSDTTEDESKISGYYGLDMTQIESWAAESNSMSSMNMDCTVVLKVKDGYAKDAAALLQEAYDQTASYAQMYQMDLYRVLQGRLFVQGNYVALIIEGQQGDWEATEEDQAKFAADEAAKVDAAWKDIFGSTPDNIITIPEAGNSVNPGMDEELPIDDTTDPEQGESKPEGSDKKETKPAPDQKPKDDTKNDTGKNETKELTAQEVLNALKAKLGSSYTSDTAESEARMSGYYGLDMSKVESWAAESNSMSSMNMDTTVVLKVKDGYAKDAAALLQQAFDQTANYAQMYQMDLHRVLQGRLFVQGNYVALIIEGQQGDWQASEEDQAKFAAEEAAKVDAAWKDIFGSAPANIITIPEASENSGFDMPESDPDLGPVIGG